VEAGLVGLRSEEGVLEDLLDGRPALVVAGEAAADEVAEVGVEVWREVYFSVLDCFEGLGDVSSALVR